MYLFESVKMIPLLTLQDFLKGLNSIVLKLDPWQMKLLTFSFWRFLGSSLPGASCKASCSSKFAREIWDVLTVSWKSLRRLWKSSRIASCSWRSVGMIMKRFRVNMIMGEVMTSNSCTLKDLFLLRKKNMNLIYNVGLFTCEVYHDFISSALWKYHTVVQPFILNIIFVSLVPSPISILSYPSLAHPISCWPLRLGP